MSLIHDSSSDRKQKTFGRTLTTNPKMQKKESLLVTPKEVKGYEEKLQTIACKIPLSTMIYDSCRISLGD